MLSYTRRPSTMAGIIAARSDEVSTMSAACLATSVPAPIAMPMSAARNAGASLTPSPVIATTLPCRCNA